MKQTNPVSTQRCFNVQITLYGRYERQMNVETTSESSENENHLKVESLSERKLNLSQK